MAFGTAIIEDASNGSTYYSSFGMRTEASGVATVTAGQTSIVVTHNIIGTPTVCLATPLADPGGRVWVSALGATTFQINIQTVLGGNLSLAWHAYLFSG